MPVPSVRWRSLLARLSISSPAAEYHPHLRGGKSPRLNLGCIRLVPMHETRMGRGIGLNTSRRWILDVHGLNRRGWSLLRDAARLDVRLAAQQFGVSKRLLHRVARLPNASIRLLSAMPIAQFVPADRASLLAFLADPDFQPPMIGQRDLRTGEHEFNLHYWHCMRAQAEQDVVLTGIQFHVARSLLRRLIETPIDRIDTLILDLRPEFRVLDVQSIEVAAMLIEAEANTEEVAHLLLCASTASPLDQELQA